MAPESLAVKIERLIMETLQQRESLPEEKRPIKEIELISIVRKKFGNGDIDDTVSNVISYLENARYKIIRTLRGELELNIRRKL